MGLNVISEVERLVVQTIDVEAGFALVDPSDQRHQLAYSQRLRLGRVLHGAALALKQEHEGEDHIDAVMSVVKGIDTYLLDYALSRGDFDNLQKSYATARESVSLATPSRDVFNVLPTDSIEHGIGRKRTRVLSISNVLSSITADEYTCMRCTDDDASSTTSLSKTSWTCRSHRTRGSEGASSSIIYENPSPKQSRHAQAVLSNVCGVSDTLSRSFFPLLTVYSTTSGQPS